MREREGRRGLHSSIECLRSSRTCRTVSYERGIPVQPICHAIKTVSYERGTPVQLVLIRTISCGQCAPVHRIMYAISAISYEPATPVQTVSYERGIFVQPICHAINTVSYERGTKERLAQLHRVFAQLAHLQGYLAHKKLPPPPRTTM